MYKKLKTQQIKVIMLNECINNYYLNKFQNPEIHLIYKNYKNIITLEALQNHLEKNNIKFGEKNSFKKISEFILKKYFRKNYLCSFLTNFYSVKQKYKNLKINNNLEKMIKEFNKVYLEFFLLSKFDKKIFFVNFLNNLIKIEEENYQIFEKENFLLDLTKILSFLLLIKNPNWKIAFRTNSNNKKISKLLNQIKIFKEKNNSLIISNFQLKNLSNSKKNKLIFKKVKTLQKYLSLIKSKKEKELKILFSKNAKLINYKFPFENHKTAFHIIAKEGNIPFFKHLLKYNKNGINIKSRNGMTPIFQAIESKNLALIKFLIKKGANKDHKDNKKNNPLYFSIEKSSDEIIEYLIKINCDLNNQNYYNRTPLMKAMFLCKEKIVKLLINSENIDLSLKDLKNRDVLHMACWGPEGGKEGKFINNFVLPEFEIGLKLILEKKIFIDSLDCDGNNAILTCAKTGSVKCLEVFREQKKGDFRGVNKFGENAFLIGVRYSNLNCVRFLVENQVCDLFKINKKGNCGLRICVKEKGLKSVFLYLLKVFVQRERFDFILDKLGDFIMSGEFFEYFLEFLCDFENFEQLNKFVKFFYCFLDKTFLEKIILNYDKPEISSGMEVFIKNVFFSDLQKHFFLNLFIHKKIFFIKIIFKLEKEIFIKLLKELSENILDTLNIGILEDTEIGNILINNIDLKLLLNYKNDINQSILILLTQKNKTIILKKLIDLLKKNPILKNLVKENILCEDIYGFDLKNYLIKYKSFWIFENFRDFLSENYFKKNKVYYSSVKILKNELLLPLEKKYLTDRIENSEISENFIKNLKNSTKLLNLVKNLKKIENSNSFKLKIENLKIKPEFINTSENFDKMLTHLNMQKILGIDMEYLTISQNSKKFTIFSLIQISSLERVYIIDSLMLYKKIKKDLKKIFEEKKILKIFHGCICDLKILYSYLNIKVNFFLDTAELYKKFFNSKKSIGLNFLTKKFFNFELDKSLQRSDWNIRPLPLILVNYAAFDAIVLIPVIFSFCSLDHFCLEKFNQALKKSEGIYRKFKFKNEFKIFDTEYVLDGNCNF